MPDGYLVDLSRAGEGDGASLPVFTIGGIKDPALAEEIVASGKADMVAMTRAQIADPEFANKAREGREDEIVHCIRGNQGCIGRVFKGLSINCTVNPAAGREARFGAGTLEPAEPPRRWLVVGGGPGGDARRGTRSRAAGTRSRSSSGKASSAGRSTSSSGRPGVRRSAGSRRDLERQLPKLGVEVRLGTEATAELVAELGAGRRRSSRPARVPSRPASRR